MIALYTGSHIILLTSLKQLAFVHILVGFVAVAVTIFFRTAGPWKGIKTRAEIRHDLSWRISVRVFIAGFHALCNVCTLCRVPGLTRNVDKNFMHAATVVWIIVNSFGLLVLLFLYNLAPDALNLKSVLLRDPAMFYGAVGLVLAMGPIHYMFFYFQVGKPLLFLVG